MSLISKSDIPRIPASISDSKIDPHIQDAEVYDVIPKIGRALLNDLWKAEADTVGYTQQERPDLHEVLTYVKAYVSLEAKGRFLIEHGHDIAPAGLIKSKDPRGSYDQLDPAERAMKVKLNTKDKNIRETEMFNALSGYSWKLDGTQYDRPGKRPSSGRKFGISAIK